MTVLVRRRTITIKIIMPKLSQKQLITASDTVGANVNSEDLVSVADAFQTRNSIVLILTSNLLVEKGKQ